MLDKHGMYRHKSPGDKGLESEIIETTIGDIGFADDTALIGWEDEMEIAEAIFVQTLTDWDEKVNAGKTERLRMSGVSKRADYDARREGEEIFCDARG